MEERVQEMLNKINHLYEDFEIKEVDLSLVRRLENVAHKVAERSLLRKLYFIYSFLFFIHKGLSIVGELYLIIDKDAKNTDYEIGSIFETAYNFAETHDLYFKFDASKYLEPTPFIRDEIFSTRNVFQKVLKEEGLYCYYRVFQGYLVVPLEAKVLHYSLL
jgi:hypothetical protein